VVPTRFPPGRTVLHFQLQGEARSRRYWWLVVQHGEEDVDVCLTDPGFPVTLTVAASLRVLVDVLMGDTKLADALRQGHLGLEGDRELARRFETLFELGASESFTGGDGRPAGAGRAVPAG
jgi:ubiquinone biosynthesis protein UbiJ